MKKEKEEITHIKEIFFFALLEIRNNLVNILSVNFSNAV